MPPNTPQNSSSLGEIAGCLVVPAFQIKVEIDEHQGVQRESEKQKNGDVRAEPAQSTSPQGVSGY